MRKPSLARTKEVLSVIALALGITLMTLTLVAGGLGVTMLMRAGSALSEVGNAPAERSPEPTATTEAPEPQPVPTDASGRPEWCASLSETEDYIPAECK